MHWRFWHGKQRKADLREADLREADLREADLREADLNDEIAYDLAADAEERIRNGLPREEAERASRRDFGNVLLLKEDIRETWGWTSFERLAQDVRYGWRQLNKHRAVNA